MDAPPAVTEHPSGPFDFVSGHQGLVAKGADRRPIFDLHGHVLGFASGSGFAPGAAADGNHPEDVGKWPLQIQQPVFLRGSKTIASDSNVIVHLTSDIFTQMKNESHLSS